MRKDLLIKAAELLEKDAANPKGVKFNLGTWGERGTADMSQPWEASCGTQACAMGLFAISGIFEAEGLKKPTEDDKFLVVAFGNPEKELFGVGYTAARQLFDITYEQAHSLFDPEWYNANKLEGAEAELLVAKRIRDLVAQTPD